MIDIFGLTTRPAAELFFRRDDPNDVRLGEIVGRETTDYASAQIVILGCPQDEGVLRNGGRTGAALAPDRIRQQFYKLSNWGITTKIFDLGNTIIQPTLEETHTVQTEIVKQILRDNKTIVSLGGGNDISYPDCRALSEICGAANLLAFNLDQHFDVRTDIPRNSGTPYRQLLDEGLILPKNFVEAGYQEQANSPFYYEYLRAKRVVTISWSEFPGMVREADFAALLASSVGRLTSIFWGIDIDVMRSTDAPGVSAPSPLGLEAVDLYGLVQYAGTDARTKIIEFTEVNPQFDIDERTSKLVAIAMHRFCLVRPTRFGTQHRSSTV